MKDETVYSVAIETSCRQGGVALGRGGEILHTEPFDASSRHATVLVAKLQELLRRFSLHPRDLGELYVSAGPGSFTGLRVGITVARTMGQQIPGLRCVAVPTPLAIAENLGLCCEHAGVILDAKDDLVYACLLRREGDHYAPAGPAGVLPLGDFLTGTPRPLVLVGEGLRFHAADDPSVGLAFPPDSPSHYPTPQGVWRVGRRMASRDLWTPYPQLLPAYARQPEAVRLWERKQTK